MYFNKLSYFLVILVIVFLSGCNGGGSNRGTPNTVYGQYESTISAGDNLNKLELQAYLESQVACFGLKESILDQVVCDTVNKPNINRMPIFGLEENGLRVDNFVIGTESDIESITRDQLIYTTPGQPVIWGGNSTSNETVSGLVLLPNGIPESHIKGVVLYYHGTVFSKAGVPSGYGSTSVNDPVKATGYTGSTTVQYILSAIYANSGYIVIAPDYVGQGIDVIPVHPYTVLPRSNALAGIYMLTALKTYLSLKGIDITKINQGSPNLYITSYSEGGSYSLWASNFIQGSYGNIVSGAGLTLKRTVGASGAYDLSGAQANFTVANVPNGLIESNVVPNGVTPESNPWAASPGCDPNANEFSRIYCGGNRSTTIQPITKALAQVTVGLTKPTIVTYMVNAFISYNYTPAAYNQVLISAFAQQQTCVSVNSVISFESTPYQYQSCASIPVESGGTGGSYTVQQLFNYNNLSSNQIANQLDAAAMGTANYYIGSTTNSQQTYAQSAQGNTYNPTNSFIYSSAFTDPFISAQLAAANIYNWTTKSPISILYLKYDSVVTNVNATQGTCNQNAPSLLTNSAPGLVSCNEVNNTSLMIDDGTDLFLYIDHPQANGIMQLAALHQIESSL